MNKLILVCLAVASCANIATAESAGPLTGVHAGNLVETPRGLRPLDLEGFSEDLDEDGQVDPLVSVQSVTAPLAAAVATPFAHTVPAAALPAAVGYVPQLGAPVTANYPYAAPAVHAAAVAYPYAAPPTVAHGVPAGYPYAASPVAHSVTYPYASSSVHAHHPIPGHTHTPYHLPLNTPYGHGLGYGDLSGVANTPYGHGLGYGDLSGVANTPYGYGLGYGGLSGVAHHGLVF